jgi:hypothetical protein
MSFTWLPGGGAVAAAAQRARGVKLLAFGQYGGLGPGLEGLLGKLQRQVLAKQLGGTTTNRHPAAKDVRDADVKTRRAAGHFGFPLPPILCALQAWVGMILEMQTRS